MLQRSCYPLRFLASLLLLFVLLQVSPNMKVPGPVDPQQLCLFHWWNAHPETEPYGPHAAASRLPVHEGGFVWGRSGHQWVKSISAYLEQRGGIAWRPESHRFNEVRSHYTECIALVQSAYFRNVNWWSASAPHAGELEAINKWAGTSEGLARISGSTPDPSTTTKKKTVAA